MTNPSERRKIQTYEIQRVLSALAYVYMREREGEKLTDEQRENLVETGLTVAFLLAKRQPELCDACAQYWSFGHNMEAEAMFEDWLNTYETVRGKLEKEK
jgi:uncharacterized protein YeaC (DUF1315 family)